MAVDPQQGHGAGHEGQDSDAGEGDDERADAAHRAAVDHLVEVDGLGPLDQAAEAVGQLVVVHGSTPSSVRSLARPRRTCVFTVEMDDPVSSATSCSSQP